MKLSESLRIRKISSFYRCPGLICLQLLLVLAFLLLSTFISNNVEIADDGSGGVKFIQSSPMELAKNQTEKSARAAVKIYSTPNFMRLRRSSSVEFSKEFYVIQRSVAISDDIAERLQTTQSCFREGTEATTSNRAWNHSEETNKTENGRDFDYSSGPACVCKSQWHGSSCSEPEIIWRAFLSARQPIRQPPKVTKNPHHVFQVISNVSQVTLETLEIQLRELADIVDVFVLCDLMSSEEPSVLVRHQMSRGFLQVFQDQILLIKDVSCSRANVVRQMRKILGSQMRPLDVLVFSSNDEILNKQAVSYLKWHNHWPQPLVFRMRWNVYGFFLQHPDKTILNSFACQLNVLEQVYKSNPDNIVRKKSQLLVLGDLNHFGGWFCEYCYQPIDIIRKLHLDSKLLANKSSKSLLNGNYHRKPVINIEFIQNLIQQGIYIDGKTTLEKLRPYDNEKYFVPDCVAKNRGKFSNVVSNFYASWDDSENDGYW